MYEVKSKKDAFLNYAETETEMVVFESDYTQEVSFEWFLPCGVTSTNGGKGILIPDAKTEMYSQCRIETNWMIARRMIIVKMIGLSKSAGFFLVIRRLVITVSFGILVLYHLILFCFKAPNPQPNVCDWPRGTCTYNKEPCPPNWHRCSQFDKGCILPTNHCCCRNKS